MSKANSRNVKQYSREELEIRQRYSEYRKTLPNQYPTDKRTGFPMKRTPDGNTILPRSLTPEERNSFYSQLPAELQKYRELNALRTSIERLESVDDHEWYEDDEDIDTSIEEREAPMTSDIIAYEGMGLDIAWVPESTKDALSEDEYDELLTKPSLVQRESIWDRKRKPNSRQRRRAALNRITREEALKIIAHCEAQEEAYQRYLKSSSVTYVPGKPIIYFEKYPGTWKGYEKKKA